MRKILIIVLLIGIWITPILDIDYNKNIVQANKKVIDDIALKYAKRDVNGYFAKLIFLQVYNDVIYIFKKAKKNIDTTKPIDLQLNEKKYKQTSNRINKLKEIVKKFVKNTKINTLYVYPTNNKGYMYKINTQTLNIYFMKSNKVKEFNNNSKYLRFDFNLRSLYFVKEELLYTYKQDLLKVFNLSDNVNNQVYNAIKNNIESKTNYAKWILTIILILGYIVIEIYINRYKNRKKDILNKIKRFELEKKEYQSMKHYSQHDIKTNSQKILDSLFNIYVYIKETNIQDKNLINMIAELNLLEYTILQANSYSKNDYSTINQYKIHKDIKEENFIKFFQSNPFEKELLKIAKNNIFNIKIDLENLEERTINKKETNLYQNELSMVFFKILNNALKHREKNTKINIYIGKDDFNRFILKISNQIISDENCENIKEQINKSIETNESHNMAMIKTVLLKYVYTIEVECKNNMTTMIIKEKDNKNG